MIIRFTIRPGVRRIVPAAADNSETEKASQTPTLPQAQTARGGGGRRGIRTLMARRPHGLANRPGKPYPTAFRTYRSPSYLDFRRSFFQTFLAYPYAFARFSFNSVAFSSLQP